MKKKKEQKAMVEVIKPATTVFYMFLLIKTIEKCCAKLADMKYMMHR